MKTRIRMIAFVASATAALALPFAAAGSSTPEPNFAGTGDSGYAGDGGPAPAAELSSPHTVAPAPRGDGYLIADTDNNRIRKVAADGTITTVAGAGSGGFNGDGLPATMAEIDRPEGVASTPDGGFLIADSGNNRIRKVSPLLGTITTVAGTGAAGDGGLGLAATLTELNNPTAVAATPDGGFLIADYGNDKIRKVSALGLIDTVAGGNGAGFSGDGGQATDAQLSCPRDIALKADGGFLIADSGNHRIRQVDASGVITTVAGEGSDGYDGDDGAPEAAKLSGPMGVATLEGGGFLIADTGNDVIRRVKNGTIKTKAGSSSSESSSRDDDDDADELDTPEDVLAVGDAMLISDTGGNRVHLFGALPVAEEPTDRPDTIGLPILGIGGDEDALPAPDAPTVGDDLNVARTEGTVRIKLPGTGAFVFLAKDASIPFGSVVDAKRGTVTLTSARNDRGTTQAAAFKGSLFEVSQKRSSRPVTDLRLRGGNLDSCKVAARRAGVATIAATRRSRRHLWGSGHGRFRTIGRHGAATVRGTIWLTADRCDGTLVRVRRGRVAVKDFRAGKKVFVRAGNSYFAKVHPRLARRR